MSQELYTEKEKLVLKQQRLFRKFHYFIVGDFIPFMRDVAAILGLFYFLLFWFEKMTLNDFYFSLLAVGLWTAAIPLLAKRFPHRQFLR